LGPTWIVYVAFADDEVAVLELKDLGVNVAEESLWDMFNAWSRETGFGGVKARRVAMDI
jgi:hypothetical protein